MTARVDGGGRRSRWIPWAFVGFFATFLSADAVLVYFAFDSWTGLETAGAYEKGLAYNRTLAAARTQEALGWQVEMSTRPAGAGRAEVAVSLADRDGRAVKASLVRVRLVRPTREGYDRAAILTDLGGGRYGGRIEVPLPGQWDLRVLVEHPGGTYQATRRLQFDSDG